MKGAHTMKLMLYNTADDTNVLNKTLELISEHDITLKEDSNISAPVIRLKDERDNLDEIANYAYLPEFNRYYYIRSMVTTNRLIWVLYLSVDVLESFKEDILNSTAEITRPMKPGDYLDVTPFREVRKEVEVFESNRRFLEQESILFSTIGQKIPE